MGKKKLSLAYHPCSIFSSLHIEESMVAPPVRLMWERGGDCALIAFSHFTICPFSPLLLLELRIFWGKLLGKEAEVVVVDSVVAFVGGLRAREETDKVAEMEKGQHEVSSGSAAATAPHTLLDLLLLDRRLRLPVWWWWWYPSPSLDKLEPNSPTSLLSISDCCSNNQSKL